MIMTNKLLPVALIAALIGGSVGALVMNRTQSASAETTTQDTARTATPVAGEQPQELAFNTAGEQTAYKTGFADGYAAASEQETKAVSTTRQAAPTSRVVYRNTRS